MRDHRAFPRVPVHLEVRYADGEDLRSAFVDSISGGGVFIRTSKPLPIGTELIMDLVLEDDPAPIRLRGRVVWERLVGHGGDGMGVRFLDPPPERLKIVLTAEVA